MKSDHENKAAVAPVISTWGRGVGLGSRKGVICFINVNWLNCLAMYLGVQVETFLLQIRPTR